MLWAFERLFWHPDKVEIEARQARDENEGVDEDAGAPPSPPPPAIKTCRVCGFTGEDAYCPDCLADTMVAVRFRRS